ncbi:MAG: glycosyltransferase family 4 protein [Bacteroidia bacterium]
MVRKKITYIISDINKAVFFEHTALILCENNFDVSFILINSKGGVLDIFLQKNNFDPSLFRRTPNDKQKTIITTFEVHYLEVGSLLFSWKQIWKCIFILKRINPAIIHCHLGAANWVGLWGGYLARIKKRIYTRHSGLSLKASFKEKILNKIQNKLATDIVAISKNSQSILLNQQVPISKISILHHGFDIERMMQPNMEEVNRIKQQYNPHKKSPVIGVVARWLQWKGIQFIIPAFKKLLLEYPEAKLCLFNISSNADYSKEIQELLLQIPKENYECVSFENNVYDLYQLFDMYVHVPINQTCEAFGQTYVEALAAGIPSIFTLSGVAPEFIKDKENALVVNFMNSEEIYDAMKILLINTELKNQLIQQGQKDVQRLFGVNTYLINLLKLYTLANG